MARGAAARGKRIAFGDGSKIKWDRHSEEIFQGNPNIAPPGSEADPDIEWVHYYRGNRLYNRPGGTRWIWNYDFRAVPGEIFLTARECKFAEAAGKGFILIEPNVPNWKTVAANKQWPILRYQEVAQRLVKEGHEVRQLIYPGIRHQLPAVKYVATKSFRQALAVMKRAALYIGPEGGLHHGAAALGVPAVVIFGGFIPPAVTGYAMHTNLTGGAEACGSLQNCSHCQLAMLNIGIEEVHRAALGHLHAAHCPV